MARLGVKDKHSAQRKLITSNLPEGADRFGNWDNVEFDKTTGKTKRVERRERRPQRSNRKDRLVVTDPDGEGSR